MSRRWLFSLLVLAFAAISNPVPLPAAQSGPSQKIVPRWEYKVLKLDEKECSVEKQVERVLNTNGEDGWELISYERLAAAIPRDADGTLLIRPAATGPGRANNPQTADSFQGTITMKMGQPQTGACRFLFKREAPRAASQ